VVGYLVAKYPSEVIPYCGNNCAVPPSTRPLPDKFDEPWNGVVTPYELDFDQPTAYMTWTRTAASWPSPGPRRVNQCPTNQTPTQRRPEPLNAFTVNDAGEVVQAPKPAPEPTFEQRQDALNNPPPATRLPAARDSRCGRRSLAARCSASPGHRRLPRSATMRFQPKGILDLARHAARNGFINMEPQVLIAHLENELGSTKAGQLAGLVEWIAATHEHSRCSTRTGIKTFGVVSAPPPGENKTLQRRNCSDRQERLHSIQDERNSAAWIWRGS
jgi:hypothetical protein